MPPDLLGIEPQDKAAAPPPAPGATPPPADGGTPPPAGEKSWIDDLPDDLKTSPSLSRYKASGIEGLARGYLNAERMISADKVPVPKDDTDTEAWDRFYKAAGRPDDPTKYEFKKPAELPSGVSYDDHMETWWRQSAHKAGLSARQASQLYGDYADRFFGQIKAGDEAAKAERTAARVELQRDWGAEFDLKYQFANAAYADMPADVVARLEQAGINRMPGFVKFMASISEKTRGESELREGPQAGGGAKTPAQLQSEIAEFRQTHNAVMTDKSHPEHDLRVKQFTALFEQLYPPS